MNLEEYVKKNIIANKKTNQTGFKGPVAKKLNTDLPPAGTINMPYHRGSLIPSPSLSLHLRLFEMAAATSCSSLLLLLLASLSALFFFHATAVHTLAAAAAGGASRIDATTATTTTDGGDADAKVRY